MSITFTLSWITLLFIWASGNYAILWEFLMVLGSRESGVGSRAKRSAVSGQRSVVSRQPSAVSRQPLAFS
ncbi:MAG: hypothetical protein F6K37_42820 [Moorea sp. SIO4E2]|uniref:hypothetical protein n=1 Tax=Moorena sp. SIO4E2 TaxID=2607826 RepID=UPI0013BCF72B|nr:hypothetical protein [Moorena sp. SIO4E2]NEQ12332.1 hypothetical protein [Moorena sp. SIO4E2]